MQRGLFFMRKSNSYLVKICITAMLTAAGFVLDRLLAISTPAVKINLAFLPAVFAAVLLGPIYGACVYGLTDLIGALVMPFGPYHPGFTVCAAVMGALEARGLADDRWRRLFIYKKEKINFLSIVIPVAINCLVIGLFINTAWVSMLYGSKTYWGWFLYRLLEYAVLVPVQLALVPAVVKLCGRIKEQFGIF